MGSYMWSIEDEVESAMEGYVRVYFPKCHLCGRKTKVVRYSRKVDYKCNYCKHMMKEKKKEADSLLDVRTKYDRRFDSAVEIIEKQVKDMRKYEKPIVKAKTACYRYGSVPEAVTAIELLRNKLPFIPQQKIGKYKVDFAIPSIKAILEIDGRIYHAEKKDAYRDLVISKALGCKWFIIHIPAEPIVEDIRSIMKVINSYVKLDEDQAKAN